MFLIFPVVTYVAQCAAIYWTVVSHIVYHFTVTVTINTAHLPSFDEMSNYYSRFTPDVRAVFCNSKFQLQIERI